MAHLFDVCDEQNDSPVDASSMGELDELDAGECLAEEKRRRYGTQVTAHSRVRQFASGLFEVRGESMWCACVMSKTRDGNLCRFLGALLVKSRWHFNERVQLKNICDLAAIWSERQRSHGWLQSQPRPPARIKTCPWKNHRCCLTSKTSILRAQSGGPNAPFFTSTARHQDAVYSKENN